MGPGNLARRMGEGGFDRELEGMKRVEARGGKLLGLERQLRGLQELRG